MTAATRSSVATRPTPSWSGLCGALNRDWQRFADLLPAGPDGTSWATYAPALAGCATVDDVLQVIRAGTPAVHDQVLHALLSRLSAGDQLAGRTVLQTMLGRVPRMTRTAQMRDLQDPQSVAVEALWQAIASYPLHRTTKVAANLALEALAAMTRAVERIEVPADDLFLEAHEPFPGVQEAPLQDAVYTLRWARQCGVLTDAEIILLTKIHLAPVRPAMADVAADLGIPASVIRQRHSVALQRLVGAVRAALAADPPLDKALRAQGFRVQATGSNVRVGKDGRLVAAYASDAGPWARRNFLEAVGRAGFHWQPAPATVSPGHTPDTQPRYLAEIHTDEPATVARIQRLLEGFAGLHPAVAVDAGGRLSVLTTIVADDLSGATSLALQGAQSVTDVSALTVRALAPGASARPGESIHARRHPDGWSLDPVRLAGRRHVVTAVAEVLARGGRSRPAHQVA